MYYTQYSSGCIPLYNFHPIVDPQHHTCSRLNPIQLIQCLGFTQTSSSYLGPCTLKVEWEKGGLEEVEVNRLVTWSMT